MSSLKQLFLSVKCADEYNTKTLQFLTEGCSVVMSLSYGSEHTHQASLGKTMHLQYQ